MTIPALRALAALAPGLAPNQRVDALREALAAAKAIGSEHFCSEALAALASHLAPEQCDEALCEALAAAKAIRDDGSRSQALAALAPHLAPEQMSEALAAAKAIDDAYCRSQALAALAARLCRSNSMRRLRKLLMLLLVSRGSALNVAENSVPSTLERGGQTAIVELFRAIKDVRGWYPCNSRCTQPCNSVLRQ